MHIINPIGVDVVLVNLYHMTNLRSIYYTSNMMLDSGHYSDSSQQVFDDRTTYKSWSSYSTVPS